MNFLQIFKIVKKLKKNSILVSRKIDAIRGALNTLESKNNSSTELYNKLGKIKIQNHLITKDLKKFNYFFSSPGTIPFNQYTHDKITATALKGYLVSLHQVQALIIEQPIQHPQL